MCERADAAPTWYLGVFMQGFLCLGRQRGAADVRARGRSAHLAPRPAGGPCAAGIRGRRVHTWPCMPGLSGLSHDVV